MVLFPGCTCCGGGGPPETGWACYECTPCLVVAFETAGTGDPANNTFHLGPYLTGHTAHAGRPYRFVEVGANCDGVDPDDPDGRYTWHGAGYITGDGTIGDPWIDYDPATGIYESSYPYRGYLRLQIGCDDPAGGDEYTAEYSNDCTDEPCGLIPTGCPPAESLVMVQKFKVNSVVYSGLAYVSPDVPDKDYETQIQNWLDGLEFRYSPSASTPTTWKIYGGGGWETCWGCNPIAGAENLDGYLTAGVNNCSLNLGGTVGSALFPCVDSGAGGEIWLNPGQRLTLTTSPQCSLNLGLPEKYTMQFAFVPNTDSIQKGLIKLTNGVGFSAVSTTPGPPINGPPGSAPASPHAIVYVYDASQSINSRVYALNVESTWSVSMNPNPLP